LNITLVVQFDTLVNTYFILTCHALCMCLSVYISNGRRN